MFKFSQKSLDKLATAHQDLQTLFQEVIKYKDCSVIEGHRSKEKQEQLVANGFSKAHYPNSPHNKQPSEAVDVVPNPVNWNDKQSFIDLAVTVKRCATKMGIEIEWGGDFKSFFDGPHYQLKQPKASKK